MADEQSPKSYDDAVDPSQQDFLEPAGDFLAGSSATAAPDYQVVDDEAEELSGEPVPDATPGKADPEDVSIDDPQQLAQAEQVAAQARSSRPVRRKPASSGTSEPAASADEAVAAETAAPTAPRPAMPRPVMPRPVRRTAGSSAAPAADVADVPDAAAPAPGAGGSSSPRPAAPAPRPVRRNREVALADDARPVRSSSSSDEVAHRRTSPAAFVGQSAAELRKVIWPTSSQLGQYFVVVLLFVLFIVAYVGLLDLFFGWGLLKLFGK